MAGEIMEISIPLSVGPLTSTIGAPTPEPPHPDLTLQAQQQRRNQLKAEIAIHHRAGRSGEVERLLNEVLALAPNDPQALYNLGVLAREAVELARAERFLKRAIEADPDYIDAYQVLGDMHYEARHLLSAIQYYEHGLGRSPNRLPILNNLMKARLTQNAPHRVAALARRIRDIDDRDRDAICYLIWAALVTDADLTEADRLLVDLKRYHPNLPMRYCLASVVAERQGRAEEAAELRRDTELLAQNSWDTARRAADLFISLKEMKRAAEMVRIYLSRNAEDPAAQRYLATVLFQDGAFVEGGEILDQVLAEGRGNVSLQMIRALNAFRLGDLETFAREHHTRWQRDGAEPMWDIKVPEWDAKPLRSGKLAVFCEQGVGDHVMYAACFAALRPYARDVILETGKRMAPLFQRSFPEFQVVVRSELPADWSVETVAAKVSAADLPMYICGDLSDLPGREGFLIPDPQILTRLRDRYRAMFPGKRLIGISWRSGNRDSAAIRSLELPYWKALFDLPDCAFISLQYGDIGRDIEELKEQLGDRVYWDKEINAIGMMDPFTAQVAAMDMVISVDNSTVHFAGGLGKPCWVMLPLNSDWRWQIDRTDTIWYESLELFRQEKETGWDGVIDRIAARMREIDDAALHAADIRSWQRAAKTLLKAERLAEAEQYCRLLLAAGEHKPLALQGIARSALAAGQVQDAVAILMRAIELSPEDPELLADLILALSGAGESDRALALARQAGRQFPDNLAVSVARGRVLSNLRRYDEATDHFARALRKDPEHLPSRAALAGLQAAQGEWDLARANYGRVLDLQSSNSLAHTALGEIDLRLEDWPRGWPNFGWRFKAWPGTLPSHISDVDPERQPKRWQNGSLKKTRLFLRAERNIAEQILFASLLPEVAKESRSILLECDPRLVPIMAASFPSIEVKETGSTTDADLTEFQVQTSASLGDLAARFRGKSEDFPKRGRAHLIADPTRVTELRAEYQACFPGRQLIGLSWRSVRDDEGCQFALADWLELLDLPHAGVVALHPVSAEAELSRFAEETKRDLIFDRRIRSETDFTDYCVQIAACDLVIAVEDVTAHLAAGLGRPVLKPLKAVDHWWWGVGEGASTWHPGLIRICERPGEARAALVHRVIEKIERRG